MTERPTTVYAVTEGSYSDYRIVGVFTSRKVAQQNIEAGLGEEIEEYRLYDRVLQRKSVHSINARIWPDGQVTAEHGNGGEPTIHTTVDFEDGSYRGRLRPIMEARTLQAQYAGKDWLVRVSGTDKARVLKAFRDRVAEAKARTLGVAS